MRVAISEDTAYRLGITWDYFKKSIPVIFIAGPLIYGFILLNDSINDERDQYQSQCAALGGYLVRIEKNSMRLCIREVQSKEKIHVST